MEMQTHPAMAETVCREILETDDPVLPAARALYESTLDEAERIPWQWLASTPQRRIEWKPGRRRPHLVVATPTDEPNRPVGFGYGAFLPGYGGYVCYLGVDPAARGRGTGTLLFRFLFQLIDSAARISAVPLPFVIWESHKPDDPALWAARLRVFDKAGGLWIRGVEMLTPNYMRPEAGPVRLRLFLRPWADPATAFDADRLRAAVNGLYEEVYHIPPDDPLRRDTLDGMVNPRLVPTVEALESLPVPRSPASGERG
jgi:GNAT superfamily N-acetyltransferase